MEWKNEKIVVTTDADRIDKQVIFDYLHHTAYWSKGIPYDICMKSLDHSVPFSVIDGNNNFVGFARLVTDHATFSYLADVFIRDEFQGQGFGKFLVQCVNDWIDSHNIRTSLLLTRDAQPLYAAFNWVHPSDVTRVMRYKDPIFGFYER